MTDSLDMLVADTDRAADGVPNRVPVGTLVMYLRRLGRRAGRRELRQ